MTEIIDVTDAVRGCGVRQENGLYLVSPRLGVGDGIGIPADLGGVIPIVPPVPINKKTVQKRGQAYVCGDAILAAPRDRVAEIPFIDPQVADAQGFSWRAFGVDWPARRAGGLAQSLEVREALAVYDGLQWKTQQDQRQAVDVGASMVESLSLDACRHPIDGMRLIVAVKQLYKMMSDGYVIVDHFRRDAGGSLAAMWRLLHAGEWYRVQGHQWDRNKAAYLVNFLSRADALYCMIFGVPAYSPCPDLIDWVGSKFYPTPADFMLEAATQGVSRRTQYMKGSVNSWTRVFLTHDKCELADGTVGPGVFGYFLLSQYQYVVGQDDKVPAAFDMPQIQPVRVRHAPAPSVSGGAAFPAFLGQEVGRD